MNNEELVYCATSDDVFDNLKDAVLFIAEVASDEQDAIGWVIDVCTKIKATHKNFFNAKDVINEMRDRAYYEYSEFVDDYLNDVERDKEKLNQLTQLLVDWFDKNAEQPRFWQVGEIVDKIVVDNALLAQHGVEFPE